MAMEGRSGGAADGRRDDGRTDDGGLAWTAAVLGPATVLAGFVVLVFAGSTLASFVEPLGERVGWDLAGFVLVYGVVAVVYAVVGVAGAYAFIGVLDLDREFVIERPEGESVRWFVGVVATAPVLVLAGTLAYRMWFPTGGRIEWMVPGTYLGMSPLPLDTPDPFLVTSLVGVAFVALTVAPSLAALVHGVLQNGLRPTVGSLPAVSATALAFVITGREGDTLGLVLLVVFGAVAGYAYERTGNLAVPMAGWAILSAVTLTAATLSVLITYGML